MENQIQQLQSQLAEQSTQTRKLETQFAQMMLMMKNIQEVLQTSPNSPNNSVHSNHSDSNSKSLGYMPRIEFPVFEGSNSSLWLKKFVRYFSLCQIPDAQKVDLAALNMIGKAELWVISYLVVHKGVEWDTFVVDLLSRFRDDLLNPLQWLKQLNMLDFRRRHLHLLEISIVFRKPRFVRTTNSSSISLKTPFSSDQPQPNTRTFIPASVRAENLATGECYYCNQPYDKNHTCQFKKTHVFTVEVLGEDDLVDTVIVDDIYDSSDLSEPCIFVNALVGSQGFQTMRVVGSVGRKPLHVLIDSGSTHNFLDLFLAQKWGCKLDSIAPQAVAVTDGSHLACQFRCKDFTWVNFLKWGLILMLYASFCCCVLMEVTSSMPS
ncbi:hypothetical protein RND81_11G033000 [Saponaria officinalis]|uniref:Uncharacterized protein n=1 Tax=Saponaria officinalis TaxID=3572 RepID=A0AAW1HHU2_SAPOF